MKILSLTFEFFQEETSTCQQQEGPMKQHTQLKVMKAVMHYFESKITEIVRFAKFIPGFRNLPIEDQTTLVKGLLVLYYFL